MSLLAKWRWQLLINGKSNWKRVVKAKYGMSMAFNPNVLSSSGLQDESLWWRDICGLGGMPGRMGNWFVVCKKIGNGIETLFWHDNWCG
jgi:hypothetical protein